MIEARELTKRYGGKAAVDRLTFTVRPGLVTGFLGPNGAGKSTTMRMILGLDAPSAGTVTVNGRRYDRLAAPLREVGSLLDAKSVHGGRSVRRHLLGLARSNAIPRRQVDAVLDQVGLGDVADHRAKGLSLGMGQRLGIAAALLGDPEVVILDEPVNGLDTEGIRWIRALLKSLAAQGRTVFLSSHLMSEMELTADRLIVIGRGRLLADTDMREFIETHSQGATLVRTAEGEAERMRRLLERAGATVRLDARGGWRVAGLAPAAIGELAREHRLAVHELTPLFSSLEEIYTTMTRTSVEYRGSTQDMEELIP
ncbi:ATP-binding cassette domain-containing protein [Streptomyces flavofungini]|uniref:ATP-binding cassette domain-containing protein n=1 Tax=Streptomyces flavofungini TaxID=68200 RepID=A0ABS0XI65_9ACTN|nr:ATP-binding cassette domain-containing protein [Streptomyces flavofungini]MBJ3812671.1 ATP-binding cassette domain-containing protein [Streptomyces flavofungini]GHC89847.1 multidrug ABC transporter ATP-binding protein [Streptomyces flavofungini]